MKTKLTLPAMLLLGLFLPGCASPTLKTVPSVDLQRYSGKWYEIARYPNWFQRKCACQSTAEYAPQADGSIKVTNTCLDKKGQTIQAIGKARVVPDSGNAKLKVSFFGPFTGDYWVIALDPKYQWAVVGHPSRKYLWVLAREPNLPAKTYQHILEEISRAGYDTSRLIKVSN